MTFFWLILIILWSGSRIALLANTIHVHVYRNLLIVASAPPPSIACREFGLIVHFVTKLFIFSHFD